MRVHLFFAAVGSCCTRFAPACVVVHRKNCIASSDHRRCYTIYAKHVFLLRPIARGAGEELMPLLLTLLHPWKLCQPSLDNRNVLFFFVYFLLRCLRIAPYSIRTLPVIVLNAYARLALGSLVTRRILWALWHSAQHTTQHKKAHNFIRIQFYVWPSEQHSNIIRWHGVWRSHNGVVSDTLVRRGKVFNQ